MRKFFLIIAAFGLTLDCTSQSNTFFLNDWTGSSQWRYNPGIQSSEKFYMYLPVIGGFHNQIGYTGFAYNDVIQDNQLNVSNLINGLDPKNHLMYSINSELFGIGIKSGKIQIRAGLKQNFESRLTYSNDMLELFWKGNGHPDVIGERMSMDGTGINAMAYLSYFVGGSAEILPNKLTVGANLNLYKGAGTIYTEKSVFGLTTDENDYSITADGEFNLQSSGRSLFTDELDVNRFLPFSVSGNRGFGFDIGLQFKPSQKIEVEASVLNLGTIKWSEDLLGYSLSKTEITYSGFDLVQLIDSNDSTDVFTEFGDSLTDSFIPSEENSTFTTSTNSEIYLLGKYLLSKKDHISLMFHNKESFGENFQSLAGIYSREFGTSLKISGGVHLFQIEDVLIPVGMVFNAGPFQLGVHTENLLAVFQPLDSKYVSASFSLGFRIGKESEKRTAKKAEKKAKKAEKKSNTSP